MQSAPITRALILLVLATLAPASMASAHLAPFVGDEGLEPGERRIESALSGQGLSVAYRAGFRLSGLTAVYSLDRRWVGGWTAAGAGVAYRILEGYPVRLIGRLEGELGASRVNGSVGVRALPGAAIEVGREGGLCLTWGGRAAVGYFPLPQSGFTLDLMTDVSLNLPIGDEWRGGIGGQLTRRSLPFSEATANLKTYNLEILLGLARWF